MGVDELGRDVAGDSVSRGRRLAMVEAAIGDRTLVWFGIRGDDAAALLGLPQFRMSFAISAPLGAAKLTTDETLERLTGRRVDLDSYDVDLDTRRALHDMRRAVLAALNSRCVLTTYRPSHFISNIHFASLQTTRYLGQFKDRHVAFEHKPWVETQLSDAGVRTLPWTYVAEEHRSTLEAHLDRGPTVLRASHTSGGAGVVLVERPDQLEERWLAQPDALIAVAPFLEQATPVNVGACVYPGGAVTVHAGSVQLIGVTICTNRRFGYCGNDFARFRDLPTSTVAEMDTMTRTIGAWLSRQGYVGTYGVDFLVDGERPYFMEVNPRFQGSTALSALLAADAGRADVLLDHISAFLGLPAEDEDGHMTLRDWQAQLPPAAQVIVHNRASVPVRLGSPAGLVPAEAGVRIELVPDPDVLVEPNGVLFRLVFPGAVTKTGFDLDSGSETMVTTLTGAFGAGEGRTGI